MYVCMYVYIYMYMYSVIEKKAGGSDCNGIVEAERGQQPASHATRALYSSPSLY